MQWELSLPSSVFFSTMHLLISAKCFLPPSLWVALFDCWFVTQQNRSGLHNISKSPPQCENAHLPPRTGLRAQGWWWRMEIHLGAQAGWITHLHQGSAIRVVGDRHFILCLRQVRASKISPSWFCWMLLCHLPTSHSLPDFYRCSSKLHFDNYLP